MSADIEFDWDDENKKHLAAHEVTPDEFEQLMRNDPLDAGYRIVDGEERYRSVGLTESGRLLSVAWTLRDGRIRAVTAFRAGASDRKAFLKRRI